MNNEKAAWNLASSCFFIVFWFGVLPDIDYSDFVNEPLKGWNAYDKVKILSHCLYEGKKIYLKKAGQYV